MKFLLTAIIKGYQRATINFAPRCKYYPSCSQYAVTAIGRYGLKGVAMAAYRILRCNPWSLGGLDYVDEELDSADARDLKLNNKKKEMAGAN
jgi:putative membrane protein insertion efficiency factor